MTDEPQLVREEYGSGYGYGYARAEYDMRNGMQYANNVIEETRSEVEYARQHLGRLTRAHTLGHARGYRHAVMDDWARYDAANAARQEGAR